MCFTQMISHDQTSSLMTPVFLHVQNQKDLSWKNTEGQADVSLSKKLPLKMKGKNTNPAELGE